MNHITDLFLKNKTKQQQKKVSQNKLSRQQTYEQTWCSTNVGSWLVQWFQGALGYLSCCSKEGHSKRKTEGEAKSWAFGSYPLFKHSSVCVCVCVHGQTCMYLILHWGSAVRNKTKQKAFITLYMETSLFIYLWEKMWFAKVKSLIQGTTG